MQSGIASCLLLLSELDNECNFAQRRNSNFLQKAPDSLGSTTDLRPHLFMCASVESNVTLLSDVHLDLHRR